MPINLLLILAIVILAVIIVFFALGGLSPDLYFDFIEWVYTRDWETILIAPALIFAVFNLALAVFIGVIFLRYLRLAKAEPEKEARVHTIPLENRVGRDWEDIRKLANSQNPSDWNMAIIRADGLLDEILQELGYEGDTVAERLKTVDPTKLSSLDDLWSAHRLRNSIVHGPLDQYPKETVIHALRAFEKAFRELGAMKNGKQVS